MSASDPAGSAEFVAPQPSWARHSAEHLAAIRDADPLVRRARAIAAELQRDAGGEQRLATAPRDRAAIVWDGSVEAAQAALSARREAVEAPRRPAVTGEAS